MNPTSISEFSLKNQQLYDRSSPGRWVLSHLRPYWYMTGYVVIGSISFISLRSYIPVRVGEAFQEVSKGTTPETLAGIALSVVAIAFCHGIINLSTAWTNETVAQRLERDAREELFIGLLSKSQTFHDMQRVGDLMARATNDVKQLNLLISPALNLLLQAALGLLVPITLMGRIHWQLLLVPLLFTVASGLALKQYIRTLGPLAGRMRGQFGQFNAILSEILTNIKLLRNFVQVEREKKIFLTEGNKYKDLFIENGDLSARYFPLLFLGIAMGAGLFHAMHLKRTGVIGFGDVIAYVGLMGQLRFPTFVSLFSVSQVQLGIASARRILETLNSNTEIDQNLSGHRARMKGHIVFEGVSFRYQATSPWVLRGLNFEILPGQRVAIVGQTGSGKTTLIKLLQRLYDVTEGRILIDGVPLQDWNLESLRSQLGVIEQDTFLFSRSIAENIAFGKPGATRDEIEAAARSAQAHEFIIEQAGGYETMVGTRGLSLSGGQKQRLAIARALLSDPPVLALDDATSAVDSATEDRIQQALRALMRQRTALVITHRLAQIRHADQILVLRKGQLVAHGSHEHLIRISTDYRDIFAVYGAELPPLQASSSPETQMPAGVASTEKQEARSWQA